MALWLFLAGFILAGVYISYASTYDSWIDISFSFLKAFEHAYFYFLIRSKPIYTMQKPSYSYLEIACFY